MSELYIISFIYVGISGVWLLDKIVRSLELSHNHVPDIHQDFCCIFNFLKVRSCPTLLISFLSFFHAPNRFKLISGSDMDIVLNQPTHVSFQGSGRHNFDKSFPLSVV